jgi:CDGSH-type Zn-finger protein
MDKSTVGGKEPRMVELKQGETYAWCACGKSSNQPWCDGSHQDTSITPLVFEAKEDELAAMCMCKQTKNPPFCDGSHTSLAE